MVASAAHTPPWEIRSELPGRLRLSWEALRHSPELRRQCDLALTACHWLHGYRINGLAGSLCLRFPEARRADLPHLLKAALAPDPSPVPKELESTDPEGLALALNSTLNPGRKEEPVRPGGLTSARVLQAQPLLLRHGSLCALALGLDLWLGLPALLVNGAAAVLTLPLLAHVWRELRERPPRWTELLDVGFSAVLLRQGLGREVLVDHALEDGGDWLQRVSAEERSREQAGLDVLRRLGSQVRVSLEADRDPVPLAAVRVADRLRLRPGLPVFLAMTLVEGGVAVIRPGGRGLWEPRAVKPGDRLEPGWLVVQGVGIGEVLCAFAED
ncbi:MAG: hypothetical protein FJ083_12425, partial [Cyanobacteria bacterium K_Offshore_surface_m2_239]|nr:hypothetical protein [Cyanobacteria bacterium K_Offshore_surface_m2_239]